jgi:hypothetical protein
MTQFVFIMTILYPLFFCKRPDYHFSLYHYLQKDYYFTYDTSIVSLIYQHKLLLLLQLSPYYLHFFTSNYCYYYYYFEDFYHTYFCTCISFLLLQS